MSVVALAPYDFPARDVRENFPAPLLYIGWEDHRMFCAPFALPLPTSMPFGDLITKVLPTTSFTAHPDWPKIDWKRVEWLRSGQAFQPDVAKSLADNGPGSAPTTRPWPVPPPAT